MNENKKIVKRVLVFDAYAIYTLLSYASEFSADETMNLLARLLPLLDTRKEIQDVWDKTGEKKYNPPLDLSYMMWMTYGKEVAE